MSARPCTISSTPTGMGGYVDVPDFAWSGWRLRIPGGPAGGQYHGFIGPDSDQGWNTSTGTEIADDEQRPIGLGDLPRDPWTHDWGGTQLDEGQTVSDHVYRAPGELRPRANASGGAHVVMGYQRRRTAGFAEAPGNFHQHAADLRAAARRQGGSVHLGMPAQFNFPARPIASAPHPVFSGPPGALRSGAINVVAQPAPYMPGFPVNRVGVGPMIPMSPSPAPTVNAPLTPNTGLSLPDQPSTVAAAPQNYVPPPSPGSQWLPETSYPAGAIITDSNGNLQQALQPGVSGTVQPNWPIIDGMTVSDGGYGTAVLWKMYSGGTQPQAAQYATEMAQVGSSGMLPASAAALPATSGISGIEAWLTSSTIYAGAPNWAFVAGGALALWFLMKKKH